MARTRGVCVRCATLKDDYEEKELFNVTKKLCCDCASYRNKKVRMQKLVSDEGGLPAISLKLDKAGGIVKSLVKGGTDASVAYEILAQHPLFQGEWWGLFRTETETVDEGPPSVTDEDAKRIREAAKEGEAPDSTAPQANVSAMPKHEPAQGREQMADNEIRVTRSGLEDAVKRSTLEDAFKRGPKVRIRMSNGATATAIGVLPDGRLTVRYDGGRQTVSVPGALLYVGDGHAAQGDGELNGNALETSMDVEFTVDVIPGKRVSGPRVESATHLMAMGLGGSLDDAFRDATSNMAQWLSDQYKLTPSEVAQVLGTSAEYKVSEVADRNAGVVLKINKERLQTLGLASK